MQPAGKQTPVKYCFVEIIKICSQEAIEVQQWSRVLYSTFVCLRYKHNNNTEAENECKS